MSKVKTIPQPPPPSPPQYLPSKELMLDLAAVVMKGRSIDTMTLADEGGGDVQQDDVLTISKRALKCYTDHCLASSLVLVFATVRNVPLKLSQTQA